MKHVRDFAVEWREAPLDARVTLIAFMAMNAAVIAFTGIMFWYTSLANMRYAAQTGDSLLVIFGSQGLIVAAFAGVAWFGISGGMRQMREEEIEEAERQERRTAERRSAKAKAAIQRLKIAVGVWP